MNEHSPIINQSPGVFTQDNSIIIESTLTRRAYIFLGFFLWINIYLWWLLVLLALLFFYTFLSINGSFIFESLVFVMLWVIFLPFLFLFISYFPGNRHLFLPHRYVLNNEQVIIETPVKKEILNWETFAGWKKVTGYYLLFMSKYNFYSISISSIDTKDFDNFRYLLNDRVKQRK